MKSSHFQQSVAVVGGGVSGLGAALWLTDQGHRVTVFEANDRLGGHAHTLDVKLDGVTHPVDTGFLVFNESTYPKLLSLFARLQVPTAASEMSFSVSRGPHQFEWAGTSLRSLFAQPTNLVSGRFWRMLIDIVRFNAQATAIAGDLDRNPDAQLSLDVFLNRHRYGQGFREQYLLPMAAAIWSCPMDQMREFPLGSFVRFFHNHGLLQILNRPQWFTVAGGSREYVQRVAAGLHDVRLASAVSKISRSVNATGGPRVQISTRKGVEYFDQVVLACHSDQSLALLGDATAAEAALLGGVRYQPNQAVLHTDQMAMPKRRGAWAAWNYLSNGDPGAPLVSVTYWLNRLQPLPFKTPLLLSLNPITPIEPSKVIARLAYEHPILDAGSAAAVAQLPLTQGKQGTWFAGAWLGFGFHEDGLRSGLAAAEALHRAATGQSSAETVDEPPLLRAA